MASLRLNIVANYVGHTWGAVMGLAFVPAYLRVLGAEAFGLVSVLLTLQALSQIFDLGTGGAINRELSRSINDPPTFQRLRNLTRSLEALSWISSISVAALIWLASGPIATHWLNPEALAIEQTILAICVMAAAIATFLPISFYSSALSGLEQQPTLNIINAAFATLRAAGAYLVLLQWPDIIAFLFWQAMVGLFHSLLLGLLLWQHMPRGARPLLRFEELRSVARLAGGILTVSILAVVVTQLDRLAIATYRPLADLGYYGVALAVSAGLTKMVQPVFNAVFPRLSRLIASDQHIQVVELYHLSTQGLTVLVAPLAAVIVFFADDVVYLWTGNLLLASSIGLPLSILIIGSIANGLLSMPYALQLAYGQTRIMVRYNAAALIILAPTCWILTLHWGLSGAAMTWTLFNIGALCITLPIMHSTILCGEMRRWLVHDVALPTCAAFIGAAALWVYDPSLGQNLSTLSWLIFGGLLSGAAAILAAPLVRGYVSKGLHRYLAN